MTIILDAKSGASVTLKKLFSALIPFAFAAYAASASAIPIISTDSVKGLIVDGDSYDVFFTRDLSGAEILSTYGIPASDGATIIYDLAIDIRVALVDLFNMESIEPGFFSGPGETKDLFFSPSSVSLTQDDIVLYGDAGSFHSRVGGFNFLYCDSSNLFTGKEWDQYCAGFGRFTAEEMNAGANPISGGFYDTVNYVTYQRSSAVPLPATLTLLCLGLAGLGWSRSRKC